MNDVNNLDMQIRLTALQLAITVVTKDAGRAYIGADSVLENAKKFADFLRGSDIPEEVAI